MKYDKSVLEKMASEVNLLDYASHQMTFSRRGLSYATNCPNHTDKTPSLFIDPEKNVFHCFSCGAGGNIFNWLMKYENMSFASAVDKVAQLTGIDDYSVESCACMDYYKTVRDSIDKCKTKEIETREILSNDYYEQFKQKIPKEWVDEGISPEVMAKYDIRIDTKSNRIVYPVFDNDGNLIGAKGRTRFEDYKTLGISKYMNYTKIGTTDFFIGMRENRDAILSADEAIIFEGIKSGMKLTTFGCGENWLAAETSCLNINQIKILVKLHIKNVVLAFDNDVNYNKILSTTKQLTKFCNVFVIRDKDNLLGENKMSPVDAGKDVWLKLYENRKRV